MDARTTVASLMQDSSPVGNSWSACTPGKVRLHLCQAPSLFHVPENPLQMPAVCPEPLLLWGPRRSAEGQYEGRVGSRGVPPLSQGPGRLSILSGLTWVLVPHPQQLPLLKLLQYMGDYLLPPRYSSQMRKLRLREGESLAIVLWQETDTAGTGTQASCSVYAPLGCATLTNGPASSKGRKRMSDLGVLAIANPCAECCAWISSSGLL